MVSPSMTRATFASVSPHGGPAHAAASASVVTATVFRIVRGRRARTAPSQHIRERRAQGLGVILGDRAIWAGFDGCRETPSGRKPLRARLGDALGEVPGSGEERAETPRVGQGVGPCQPAPRFHAPAKRRSGYHLRPERIETREARRFRGGRKVEGT